MLINKTILQKTTQCIDNFECLKTENHICLKTKVTSCIGGKVHFINCDEKLCNYKMSYGYSSICNCPTRKELFNKYNK